jgi:hypothetical protein
MEIKPLKSWQHTLLLALCFIFLNVILILLLAIYSGQSSQLSVNIDTVQLAVAPRPQFKDVTQITGIHHSHIQHSGRISDLIDSTHASACVADFNNDSWVDILFVNGGGQRRFYGKKSWWQEHRQIILYKNSRGQFKDLKAFSPEIGDSSTSCSVADFNGDGLSDLVIGTTGEDLLYKNKGNFVFEKITAFSAASEKSWTSHISVVDINKDGLPDIHLSKFINYRQNQKNLELSFGFSEQHHLQLEAGKFDGLANIILINQGDFLFQDQTKALGLSLQPARTLSSAWIDVNQDQRLDLIEHNVGDNPLKTYLQNKNGSFTELVDPNWALRANNVHYSAQGQQINDQNPFWIATRPAGLSSLLKYVPNFTKDISWPAGIASHKRAYQSQWGSVFSDVNNDGFTDVIIANGSLRADEFSPKMAIPMPSLCAIRQDSASLQVPLFDASPCSSQRLISARSVLRLDYNNDGNIDLLFLANNDFPLLLKNTNIDAQNWIGLQPYQWQALAIKIESKTLTYTQNQRQALFGTHDQRWHLGLGTISTVVVTLKTRSGKDIHQQTLAANRYYSFDGKQWVGSAVPPSKTVHVEHVAEARIVDNENAVGTPHLSSLLLNSLTQEKSEVWLDRASQLLQEQSQAQLSIAAKTIEMYPESSALPFYLSLLLYPNTEISTAAFTAITWLEDEYSASVLLALLDTANPAVFCNIAKVFAHWLEQEEAVIRGKGRAIPYFIKSVSHFDPKIVNCSAMVLAQAEHINGGYAIIDVLDSANEATLPTLISAVGNIRQKDASTKLIDIFDNSQRADVLQQTLIALKRLDYNQFEALILNKQNSSPLWLALSSLHFAHDAVVIPESLSAKWLLLTKQSEFKDFSDPSNRSLYLRSFSHSANIFTISDASALTEADRNSPYYIEAILNMESFTPAILNALVDQSLSDSHLKRLSAFVDDIGPISNLHTNQQVSNIISLWENLNKSQKYDVEQLLKKQNFVDFSSLNKKYVLTNCAQSNGNQRFESDFFTLHKQLLLLRSQCSFLHQIRQGMAVDSEQLSQIISDSQATPNAFLRDINLVSAVLNRMTLNTLSSLILYRSSLSKETKRYWAIHNIDIDKLSQAWISKQIEIGDNVMLEQLLMTDKISLLGNSHKLESLLKNASISDEVKYGISGIVKAMKLLEAGT